MGMCQSAQGGGDGEAWCPTVFELERITAEKRGASTRLHVNLVNIEFRRGMFEVYRRGRMYDGDDSGDEDDIGGSGGGSGSAGGGSGTSGGPVDMMATIGNPAAAAAAASAAGGRKKMGGEEDFIATHKSTGRAYAVRVVAVPASRSAREVEELWKVFDAQAALDHPNICRLQEIFCSEGRYYVITDLCSGGDLMERLASQGKSSYEEPEAADIVRKISGALSHCHSEGIVHGNLRLESCLFDDTGRWADIKIVDAGLYRQPHGGGSHRSVRLTNTDTSKSGSGSRRGAKMGWYMPPEVRSGGVCTEAGDMWMLGVLAWMVLTGPLPQPGVSQESARTSIMMGKPLFKGAGWAKRSPQALDFVSRLLQKDAGQRMTAAEALEHPWLSSHPPPAADAGAGAAWGGGEEGLSPSMCASLHAFKESCVMRRLGLRLVGRTLEASKMFPAKEAFRVLDPSGRGFITEAALAKGLRAAAYAPFSFFGSKSGTARTPEEEAAAAADAAAGGGHDKLAHEVFEAMDPEGSGRVGFSTFLAACLAGRPADEAGARVAFSWLDRKKKGAINSGDIKLFTGEVLPREELDDAFHDAHDALDLMSVSGPAGGRIGSAVREMEARKSAASGATGGFTYSEFYRLLASTPSLDVTGAARSGGGVDDGDGGDGRHPSEPMTVLEVRSGGDDALHEVAAAGAGEDKDDNASPSASTSATTPEPAPPFAERVKEEAVKP